MKEIQEQTFEVLIQKEGQEGIEKIVETAGRTSYLSTSNGKPENTKQFCQSRLNEGHFAVFEFGAVYLQVPKNTEIEGLGLLLTNRFSRYMEDENFYYITTNERVLLEKNLEDFKEFMCFRNEPTIYHPRRIAVKIQTCRQVTHELVRHRGEFGNSFLQESTRYCLYMKEKFGATLTFMRPTWLSDEENQKKPVEKRNFFRKYWDKFRFWLADVPDYASLTTEEYYHEALKSCEKFYFGLHERGWVAQKCAMVLNNALKADICVTMFDCDWEHFFDLRTSYIHKTGMPHPMMYDIADKIYNEFVKRGLTKDRVNNE